MLTAEQQNAGDHTKEENPSYCFAREGPFCKPSARWTTIASAAAAPPARPKSEDREERAVK